MINLFLFPNIIDDYSVTYLISFTYFSFSGDSGFLLY
jgi:hypothetical protein